MRLPACLLLTCFFASLATAADAPPAKMKFNDVRELAPGVFFRYSAISPTDINIFGGSNNIWVVMKDYVVVIDANFPKEAADVLAAIKKTTDKPVRYVLDTHHHGDHAWGNAVWVKAGATIVASRNTDKIMRESGLAEFVAAGKGPMGRKDVAASKYETPSLVFDDKLVLDDGTTRVEFHQLGHSHTVGDVVTWIPKHGVLCTGDACVNGAFNYMGQSDSASWVRCLERMQAFAPKIVAPGHGLPDTKDLLTRQRRYFVELREQVKKGIDAGKDVEDIVKSVKMPWYKEWTTVDPASDNVKHVYNEYNGLVSPWDFEYDLGILAGPSPTKDSPGWTKPKKIVLPAGLAPGKLAQLKKIAPDVEFLPAKSPEDAAKLAADADAVVGFADAAIVKAGTKLRWIHATGDAPPFVGTKATVTDTRRARGPAVADQTFALLLALTRNVLGREKLMPVELKGKNVLVVGLGGTGEQIARRAAAFGARVHVLDDAATERPAGVERLGKLAGLKEALPSADVVVLALPMTGRATAVIGKEEFAAMKKSALLVNAAHPALVNADALAEVMKAKGIGGAAVAAGRPLPPRHPLKAIPGLILTEAKADDGSDNEWRLTRENVRRFASGEALLGVVTPSGK